MFRRGKTYRHVNAKDLDIMVLNVEHICKTYVRIKVLFMFRNGVVAENTRIKIMLDDLPNWSEVKC